MSKLAISLITILSLLLLAAGYDAHQSKQRIYKFHEQVSSLESQISALESANKALIDESTKIKADSEKIKSIKPEMPVSISYRTAMMGPGLVAIISTTIKQPVPVIATFTNPSLGRSKKMEIHLSANSSTEIGHAEGVTLENGDTITIENKNYSPITFTVSN